MQHGHQAYILTQFKCDLFLANAVHASHVCDIVGDLAVHTLQPTWETELWKFIYKYSSWEFWILEFRISICTFRKRLSMPSRPPRCATAHSHVLPLLGRRPLTQT